MHAVGAKQEAARGMITLTPRHAYQETTVSVIVASVNPHRLGFSGAREAAFSIELDRAAIGDQNVLVKPLVFRNQSAQDFRPDPLTLAIGMNKQMRVVDDKKAIREGFAEADQLIVHPCGNYAVRIS